MLVRGSMSASTDGRRPEATGGGGVVVVLVLVVDVVDVVDDVDDVDEVDEEAEAAVVVASAAGTVVAPADVPPAAVDGDRPVVVVRSDARSPPPPTPAPAIVGGVSTESPGEVAGDEVVVATGWSTASGDGGVPRAARIWAVPAAPPPSRPTTRRAPITSTAGTTARAGLRAGPRASRGRRDMEDDSRSPSRACPFGTPGTLARCSSVWPAWRPSTRTSWVAWLIPTSSPTSAPTSPSPAG